MIDVVINFWKFKVLQSIVCELFLINRYILCSSYQKLLPFSFANKVAPHCTKKWHRRRDKKYNKSVRTRLFWSHNCRIYWLKQKNKKGTFEKTVRTGLGKNSGRNNTGERNERNTFDKTARTGEKIVEGKIQEKGTKGILLIRLREQG